MHSVVWGTFGTGFPGADAVLRKVGERYAFSSEEGLMKKRHTKPKRGGKSPTRRKIPDGPPGPDMLQHAKEEAEGIEVYEDPFAAEAPRLEREEAQGVEVFVNPDAVIPSAALREGSPGHELLVGDQVGLEPDGEEETHERAGEEKSPEA
jgi:hypothetical protein